MVAPASSRPTRAALVRYIFDGWSDARIGAAHGLSASQIRSMRKKFRLLKHAGTQSAECTPERMREVARLADEAWPPVTYSDHPRAASARSVGHLPARPHPATGGGSFGYLA